MQFRSLIFLITVLLVASSLSAQLDTRVDAPQNGDDSANSSTPIPQATGGMDRWVPVAGVQDFFARLPLVGISWDGQFSEVADSHPLLATPSSSWDEISRFNGTVAYRHDWSKAMFLADYIGGMDLYAHEDQLDAPHHQVALNQTFSVKRWDFVLGQQVTYTPQATLGFNGSQFLTGGGAGLNPSLNPSQSILTWQKVIRLSDTSDAQADYHLSANSSVNFSGSYAQLRFSGIPGLRDDNQLHGSVGYNVALSGVSAVGITHTYQELLYPGSGLRIRSQSPALAYQRSINRLKIKVSAGPQIRTYDGVLPNPGVDISWGASAGAQYNFRTTDIDVAYSHSLLGGSGFLPGSQGDMANTTITHTIGPDWTVNISAQYARNSSLVGKTTNLRQIATAEFVSGQVMRQITGNCSAFLGYSFRTQDTTTPLCIGSSCQSFPNSHQFTVGISLASRPAH